MVMPYVSVLQKDYKANAGEYEEGQEVLCVRAYGSSFFTLGINIRYYLLCNFPL